MTEETIFAEAIARPPGERSAYLDEACGDDTALRERVEVLLRSHEEAGSFLAKPVQEDFDATLDISFDDQTLIAARSEELRKSQAAKSSQPAEDHEPASVNIVVEPDGKRVMYFGDYELQGEIARGAMGVVYRAEQKSLKRTVAIKMIRSTLLTNDVDVARFHAEAESAASLDHPNIVPIYEVGVHEEQHYFSMKLIEGGTLRDHLGLLKDDPKAAVKLLSKVAGAIHTAHQRGILHRDLKPGNILIDEDGQPHVSDFGLAKQMESNSSVTLSGQIMGTPQYMAPEQAEGGGKTLTTAADVYGLGAIFYEMLCGRPPHQGESLMDTLKLVAEAEAAPLSKYNPKVDRDLETIAMKCLERDPAKRYASAQGLKNDLNRWLAGEPIEARPVGTPEKVIKWMKRKPMHASASGVTLLFLLTLGIGGPIAAIQQAKLKEEAEDAKTVAEEERETARQALARSALSLAEAALREGNGFAMQAALEDVPENLRDSTWRYLLEQSDTSIARIDIGAEITGVAAHPRLPHVFAVVERGSGKIIILNVRTGVHLLEFRAEAATGGMLVNLAFSPDGERIAVGPQSFGSGLAIHGSRDGKKLLAWDANGAFDIEFSPDGRSLVHVERDSNSVKLWDSATGQLRWEFNAGKQVFAATFTPDGRHVLAKTNIAGLVCIGVKDGSLIWNAPEPGGIDLAVDPDGDLVVAGWGNGSLSGIDPADGSDKFRLTVAERFLDNTAHLAFTAAGEHFCTIASLTNGRQLIQLREAETGTIVRSLLGGRGRAENVAVHPLSGELVVGGPETRVWSLQNSTNWSSRGNRGSGILFWGADDVILAPADSPGNVLLHQVGNTATTLFKPTRYFGRGSNVCEDGRLAVSSNFHILLLRRNGSKVEEAGEMTPLYESINQLSLSPKGDRVACISGRNNALECFETANGAQPGALDRENMKTFQDIGWISEQHLIGLVTINAPRGSSGSGEQIVVWDVSSGKVIKRAENPGAMDVLAIAPGGKRFAEAGVDKKVRIRDVDSLAVLQEFRAHDGDITALAWHPDRPILATGSADFSVRLWDLETGRRIEEFRVPLAVPHTLTFSPGGGRLGCASSDHVSRIWDPPSLNESGEVIDEIAWFPEAEKPQTDEESRYQEMESLMRSEKWAEAAELGRQRFEAQPDDWNNWLNLATALIQLGDKDGYELFREELVEGLDSSHPRMLGVGIKASLILPAPGELLDKLAVKESEAGLEADLGSPGQVAWTHSSLALMALRQRNFEVAEAHTVAGMETPAKHFSEMAAALNLAIRANAEAKAGNSEAARRSLDETAGYLETRPGGDYFNWLIADILREEAEAVLAEREKKK